MVDEKEKEEGLKYPKSSAGAYILNEDGSKEPADESDGPFVEDEVPVEVPKAEEEKVEESKEVFVEPVEVKVPEEKKLSDILKEKGLDLAESQVEALVHGVFECIELVVKKTDNKIDDAVIGFLPQLKDIVLEKVDKIDGEEG